MQSSVLCLLGFMAVGASAMFPMGGAYMNPWNDMSLCSPGDTPPMCQIRKSKCSSISKVMQGPMGAVGSAIVCANKTGIMPGPDFFMTIGLAFAKGTPEMLANQITADPDASSAIRMCVLNNTGLLAPDMTINRDALAMALNSSFSATPALADSVMAAAYSCDEPADFRLTDFINCIKSTCMSSVDLSTFMTPGASSGGSYGGSYGGPSGMSYGSKPWGSYYGAP